MNAETDPLVADFEVFGLYGSPFIINGAERIVRIIWPRQLGFGKFVKNADIPEFLAVAKKRGLSSVGEDLFDPILEYAKRLPERSLFHLGSDAHADGAGGIITKCLSCGTLIQISNFCWPPDPRVMAMFREQPWLFE